MTSTFEQAVMEVSKMHESQMLYRGGQQGFVLSMHFQTSGNSANTSLKMSPTLKVWFSDIVK